jgi:hypothetical protein
MMKVKRNNCGNGIKTTIQKIKTRRGKDTESTIITIQRLKRLESNNIA